MIRRIKACLEIANRDTSNEHEIATAFRQAQRLMAQYDLTEHDVNVADVTEITTGATAGKKPPNWEQRLAAIVSNAFGCHLLFQAAGRNNKGLWIFIGVGADAEIATYTFEVLQRKLRKARQHHIETRWPNVGRESKIQHGDMYCEGWLDSVSEQVVEFATENSRRQKVDDYLSNKYPSLGKLRAKKANYEPTVHDYYAYSQGRSAGSHVSLNVGVGGENDEGKYLTHTKPKQKG